MTPINHPFRRHALAIALALASGTSQAATINVTGACTLVNAINNANSDTDTDGAGGCPAGSGADTLELEANKIYTLSLPDNGDNGLPIINSVITINGNGATIRRSSETGAPEFRLINNTGDLTINNLNLTGGLTSKFFDGGGGIYNRSSATLSLNNSNVSGNSSNYGGGISNRGESRITNSSITKNIASCCGGGLFNLGVITITNSTISGNSASAWSGAIDAGGGVTITDSTISGNTAPWSSVLYTGYFSGGVKIANTTISGNISGNSAPTIYMNWGANLTLTNSTISGNKTYGASVIANGTYYNLGNPDLEITHSTFSNNGSQPAIWTYFPENTVLTNSIIADTSDSAPDCLYWPILQGVNLIADGSCGATLTGDAKLRTLLDNGGLTPTYALPSGSPANFAADPAFCAGTTDQRNVGRPAICDLGAFERKAQIPKSVAPLVQFFDAQVAAGTIVGRVKGEAFDRRVAVRNQLLTAGDYRTRRLKTDSCAQLTRTLEHIVTDNTPEDDDYVTGSGTDLLIDQINALKGDWVCS